MAAKRSVNNMINVTAMNSSEKRRSNFIDRNELIVMHLQDEIGQAL